MKFLKGLSCFCFILFAVSINAQISESNSEAEEFLENIEAFTLDGTPISEVENQEVDSVDDRYLDYIEYLDSAPSEKLTGFNVPESRAIRLLYSRENYVIATLSDSDKQAFLLSKSEVSNTQKFQNDLRDYCRLVLSSEYNGESFSRIMSEFHDFNNREEDRVVQEYGRMLSSLSAQGKNTVIGIKERIHSRMSSSESDWLALGLSDPEKYFEYQKYNCELR